MILVAIWISFFAFCLERNKIKLTAKNGHVIQNFEFYDFSQFFWISLAPNFNEDEARLSNQAISLVAYRQLPEMKNVSMMQKYVKYKLKRKKEHVDLEILITMNCK